MSSVNSFKCSLINKESENIFSSEEEEEEEESYNIEYESTNQCQYDIDDIKRERIKKDEEHKWASLNNREDDDDSECPLHCFRNIINPRQVLENNLEEATLNEELKRFEQDAFLEETKKTDKPKKKLSQIDHKIKCHHMDDDDKKSCDTYIQVPKAYEDPLIYERSPISKLDFKISKSRYENTIRRQRKHQHQRSRVFPDHNYREYELSPEIISHDRDQYSSVNRPHPVIAQKILDIQVKISEFLDEINYRLCRIPVPDGEIDLKRRQQRMMEFIVRFSRNYLYDIGRQMSDIQRHIQVISPNARIKPSKRIAQLHMQALETKLYSIHQLLFNALCAYCKHIPSSCLRGHPGKLKEILQIVIDLKNVCSKINLTTEYFGVGDAASPPLGEDIQQRCDTILSKFYSNSEKASSLYRYDTQSTLRSSVDTNKRRKIRTDGHKIVPNRFSMYCTDNRYFKTQKKRPITVGFCMKEQKSSVGKLKSMDNPSTATNSVSNVILNNTKKSIKCGVSRSKRFQKEDDIKTIVEMIPVDSEEGNSTILSRICSSSMSNLNRKVVKKTSKSRQRDKGSKPSTTTTSTTKSSKQNFNSVVKDQKHNEDLLMSNKQFCDYLPIITHVISLITEKQKKSPININGMTVESLLEILKEHSAEKSKDTEEQFLINAIEDHVNSSSKIPQTTEALHYNSKRSSSRTNRKKKNEEEKQNVDTSVHNVGNERNPKLIPLIVSQESINELLDYRNKFHDTCKLNPMYTSNSQNKPWEVVSWIADKLVDEMIVEISKELQIDDVIQKLFDLEFQEF